VQKESVIARTVGQKVDSRFFKGKTIVIIGARQTGKSTMIRQVLAERPPHLFLDGDDPLVRSTLENISFSELEQLVGQAKIVFVDEAQRIPNIGLTLKMMHDRMADVQVIASGSSPLDLADIAQEPLTGRKTSFEMLPVSWQEWKNHIGHLDALGQLHERLVFGMYPEVLMNSAEAQAILSALAKDYLYKDILALTGIKKPEILEKLLRALALQLGNEVSYNELSQLIGADKNTVSSYMDLLEKTFVIVRLPSLSRNARNEIKQSRKVYFWDNGIRNALLGNYTPIDLRTDKGALWENFILTERMKYRGNAGVSAQFYFWRTVQGAEIDFIEETPEGLHAFEAKYTEKPGRKAPLAFSRHYEARFDQIHRGNFWQFLVD